MPKERKPTPRTPFSTIKGLPGCAGVFVFVSLNECHLRRIVPSDEKEADKRERGDKCEYFPPFPP
jgi:hypothetical protein